MLLLLLSHSSGHVRRFDFWTHRSNVLVASFSTDLIKNVEVIVTVFKKLFIIFLAVCFVSLCEA